MRAHGHGKRDDMDTATDTQALYQSPIFQELTGGAWHPAGLDLTRHALELARLAPHARVLDVGCGAGASLNEMRKQGLAAFGIDMQCAVPKELKPFFIQASGTNLPLKNAAFHAVTCECVLSILGFGALNEFFRVLAPNGLLLLSDLFQLLDGDGASGVDGASGLLGASGISGTRGAAVHSAENAVSCVQGAVSRAEWENALTRAGFRILYFEDHTRALKELSAQLLWRGENCAAFLQGVHGAGNSCTCAPRRRYGYGLWIAQKTAH